MTLRKTEKDLVIINGVTYIPAKEALANELDIAKGLLLKWYGECTDGKARELIDDPTMYVCVSDDPEIGGESLRTVLDDIAKVSKVKRWQHKETGRICERYDCPGERWIEIKP